MAATGDLQLNSSMRCAKYMLLIVSFMFGITAVLLILVGSAIQGIFYELRPLLEAHFLAPAALLIVIGCILLCVATLGAYGGIKESVMVINLYGVCLFLVFILEVAAAIVAFVMQGQVHDMLEVTMHQAMADYDKDELTKGIIDFMQTNLRCCGSDSPMDWPQYLNTSLHHMNGSLVPHSCCGVYLVYNDTSGECIKQYQDGCFAQMDFIISQNAFLIASSAATVAFVQLLGSICAFMLAKTLRRHKSIREARRWQLQQSLSALMSAGKMDPTMNSPTTGSQWRHLNFFVAKIISFEPNKIIE